MHTDTSSMPVAVAEAWCCIPYGVLPTARCTCGAASEATQLAAITAYAQRPTHYQGWGLSSRLDHMWYLITNPWRHYKSLASTLMLPRGAPLRLHASHLQSPCPPALPCPHAPEVRRAVRLRPLRHLLLLIKPGAVPPQRRVRAASRRRGLAAARSVGGALLIRASSTRRAALASSG